jgi:hypothetical protein
MWIGKVAISRPEFHRVARLAGISLSEVLSHRTDKQHNLETYEQAIALLKISESYTQSRGHARSNAL